MSGRVGGKKPIDYLELDTRLPLFRRLGASPWAETFDQGDFPAYKLYADEAQIICSWGKTTNVWNAPRLLRSLVQERLDGTERGIRAREAQLRLGLLEPFTNATLELLLRHERVGPKKLDGFHFHYNGHMTRAMFPLFQILEGIGLSEGSATRSAQSGTYPVQGMMNFLLDGKRMRPREAEACFMGGEVTAERVGPPDGVDPHQWMKQCALKALEAGQTFVVDKGSTLLVDGKFPEELIEPIEQGKIRFLIHNTDDLRELEPHLDRIWAVDIAGSLMKAVEAHVIGEQYALLAAREVRKSFDGEKIANVDQYVIGFGLLGWTIAEALARFAVPEGSDPAEVQKYRKHVVVVEKDPKRRKAAENAGFTAISPEEHAAKRRRGVAIVATSGGGIDDRNVRNLSDETLILSLTTGGKGVDRDALERAFGKPHVVKERQGAVGNNNKKRKTFADLKYVFGDRSATVINGGFALNLFEESWSDRFGITAAAVIMGVITAANVEGPGKHEIPEDHLVASVLMLYEKAGLLEPRPLDSDDPLERDALAADLLSFKRTL